MNEKDYQQLLDALRERTLPVEEIGPAIVKLGKPSDPARIAASHHLVASYLRHPDSWVRHEAIWFLGCWAKLHEYESEIIDRLLHDPDVDNRAYAALCLGRLCHNARNRRVTQALARVVLDEKAARHVRLNAYGALLECEKDASPLDFQTYAKDLADIDWEWVRALSSSDAGS